MIIRQDELFEIEFKRLKLEEGITDENNEKI